MCRSSPELNASISACVPGQVGHDPHLDLAVVGGQQRLEARADDERLAGSARPSAVRIGMFCRLGSVDDSRPVAATIWLNVVWIRPCVVDHRDQRVDDALEPGDVAVAQQVLEHRVVGLGVAGRQRVGVGGVAGLDPLGLGQPELVEQDLLQLLGRAEVELAADDARSAACSTALTSPPQGRLDRSARCSRSAAMPMRSIRASTSTSGSSTSLQQPGRRRAARGRRRARRPGRRRRGPARPGLGGGVLLAGAVEGELAGRRSVSARSSRCR